MLLPLLFFSALVLAYHPTEQEMEQFYGPAHSNAKYLMPLPEEIFDPVWQAKAQGTTFRDSTGGRLYVGAISNYGELHNGDTKYGPTLNQQYNLQTAENECKWDATEPNENSYSWTQCDYASDFARNSTSAFRGHNLCWGQQNPGWLTSGQWSVSQLETFLKDHITQCIQRYNGTTKTATYCWDVVNEAVDDSGSSNVYKTAVPWYPAIPNYVNLSFQYARGASSSMKLFYNDYGGEGAGTKSDKIYNMVKSMKQGGIPIDGVGLQMHISTSYYPSPTDIGNNIKRLNALGLEVHITEMDVACTGSSQYNTQAQIYGNILQTCLSNPGCKSFQTWGFTDKYTWLGTNQHPLPFDENYNWKPAANTILSVLNAYGGINAQVWSCHGLPEQQWSFGPDGEVMTKSDGWCLDIQLSGTANKTNAWTYPCGSEHTNPRNQRWKLPPTFVPGEIVAVESGKCLEVEESETERGTNVRIAPCSGQPHQVWRVVGNAIAHEHSGLCLDAGSWRD
jgi:endo-1,4-beta-xylanase